MLTIEITPITTNVIASAALRRSSVVSHTSRSGPASQVAATATNTIGASTT